MRLFLLFLLLFMTSANGDFGAHSGEVIRPAKGEDPQRRAAGFGRAPLTTTTSTSNITVTVLASNSSTTTNTPTATPSSTASPGTGAPATANTSGIGIPIPPSTTPTLPPPLVPIGTYAQPPSSNGNSSATNQDWNMMIMWVALGCVGLFIIAVIVFTVCCHRAREKRTRLAEEEKERRQEISKEEGGQKGKGKGKGKRKVKEKDKKTDPNSPTTAL